jgi:hypothetical protein
MHSLKLTALSFPAYRSLAPREGKIKDQGTGRNTNACIELPLPLSLAGVLSASRIVRLPSYFTLPIFEMACEPFNPEHFNYKNK